MLLSMAAVPAAAHALPRAGGARRPVLLSAAASEQDVRRAVRALRAEPAVGFDCEWVDGHRGVPVSLVQLAARDAEYLFRVTRGVPALLAELLADPAVLKVGFDLRGDTERLARWGVAVGGALDLRTRFAAGTGLKRLMACVLGWPVDPECKRIACSNWNQAQLTPRQIDYAARDARACLDVYQALCAAGPRCRAPTLPPVPTSISGFVSPSAQDAPANPCAVWPGVVAGAARVAAIS